MRRSLRMRASCDWVGRAEGALWFLQPHPLIQAAKLIERAREKVLIDSKTATTRWRGEHMDCSTAVDHLIAKERRARDVPAETA
jgi:hypothetical protein